MNDSISYRLMKPGEEAEVFSLVECGFNQFVRDDCTPEGRHEFFRATRVMVFNQPPNHFIMFAVAPLEEELSNAMRKLQEIRAALGYPGD